MTSRQTSAPNPDFPDPELGFGPGDPPDVPARPLRTSLEETAMKLSSLLLAMLCAAVVIAGLAMVLGVRFHGPMAQGAALYNPATEKTVTGTVTEVRDFTCPVSEGEIGSHLTLKTADGVVQVHLAPGRVMRSQKITFAPGDQLTVTGSQVRALSSKDLIAREIIRGSEVLVFRDHQGNLMMSQ